MVPPRKILVSRILRQLLNQDDALFAIYLSKLEQMAGKPAIDVRLTAEILSTTRHKISSLGLDPDDSTGEELFAALQSKVLECDDALQSYLGHPSSSDEAAKKIDTMVKEIVDSSELWCVKTSVLKVQLKKNPPKKVMKAFRFQSIDSMNKRMDIAEVVFAARILESKTWWTKQKKLLESLTAKDFEKTKLRAIYLKDARWLPILSEWEAQKGHSIISAAECGAVGYVLAGKKVEYISTIPLLLHACNEIVLHAAYLKLHYVHPSIGLALVHAIDERSMIHSSVSGVSFHWRDVQRYFGSDQESVEMEYAHLDVQDLGWIHIEALLSLKVPEFAFWVGCDFIGVSYGAGKNISFNVHDMAVSVRSNLGYQHMFTSKMERALRSELMARYLHVPITRALVIKQFDISSSSEENW